MAAGRAGGPGDKARETPLSFPGPLIKTMILKRYPLFELEGTAPRAGAQNGGKTAAEAPAARHTCSSAGRPSSS